MFAITWSRPRATKVKVGHQIELESCQWESKYRCLSSRMAYMIFETVSRDEMEKKTARQTSQLAIVSCQSFAA